MIIADSLCTASIKVGRSAIKNIKIPSTPQMQRLASRINGYIDSTIGSNPEMVTTEGIRLSIPEPTTSKSFFEKVGDKIWRRGHIKTNNSPAMTMPEIGNKLKYVFGKATGSAHNIERSTSMARQLSNIGIFDNAAGNTYLSTHLKQVLNDITNTLPIQANGRVIKESLLMGPYGSLKMHSVWEGNKLITIELFG